MLINDLRFAVRALARSRTFAITAVLTLALGISVNTAIFSVIDSILLRRPPFDEPDRIVTVEGRTARRASLRRASPIPMCSTGERTRRRSRRSRSSVARRITSPAKIRRSARVALAFPPVLSGYSARPQLGRSFTAEEETLGRERVVVLSDAYWRRRFGGDRDIIGRQLSSADGGTPSLA